MLSTVAHRARAHGVVAAETVGSGIAHALPHTVPPSGIAIVRRRRGRAVRPAGEYRCSARATEISRGCTGLRRQGNGCSHVARSHVFFADGRRAASLIPSSSSALLASYHYVGFALKVAVREWTLTITKGNLYSIENKWDQHARIFFAQGCETLEESG